MHDNTLHTQDLIEDDIKLIKACTHLVTIDRVKSRVTLTHSSVRDFLLSGDHPYQLSDVDVDEFVGQCCLAYLSFKDFEQHIVPQVQEECEMRTRINPREIEATLLKGIPAAEFFSKLRRTFGWLNASHHDLDLRKVTPSLPTQITDVLTHYALLQYVIDSWLDHNKYRTFTWGLMYQKFKPLVLGRELPFEFRPWNNLTYEDSRTAKLISAIFVLPRKLTRPATWAVEHDHTLVYKAVCSESESLDNAHLWNGCKGFFVDLLCHCCALGSLEILQLLLGKYTNKRLGDSPTGFLHEADLIKIMSHAAENSVDDLIEIATKLPQTLNCSIKRSRVLQSVLENKSSDAAVNVLLWSCMENNDEAQFQARQCVRISQHNMSWRDIPKMVLDSKYGMKALHVIMDAAIAYDDLPLLYDVLSHNPQEHAMKQAIYNACRPYESHVPLRIWPQSAKDRSIEFYKDIFGSDI